MTIITVSRVPTITRLARNIYDNPAQLTNKQLLNRYGLILSAKTAQERGLLSTWGTKEAWHIVNMEYCREQIQAELEKRGLWEKYTFFIEIGFKK